MIERAIFCTHPGSDYIHLFPIFVIEWVTNTVDLRSSLREGVSYYLQAETCLTVLAPAERSSILA